MANPFSQTTMSMVSKSCQLLSFTDGNNTCTAQYEIIFLFGYFLCSCVFTGFFPQTLEQYQKLQVETESSMKCAQ